MSRSETNIKSITSNISTETREEFCIQDNVVTCSFNFRRRPFLVSTYMRNNVSNMIICEF